MDINCLRCPFLFVRTRYIRCRVLVKLTIVLTIAEDNVIIIKTSSKSVARKQEYHETLELLCQAFFFEVKFSLAGRTFIRKKIKQLIETISTDIWARIEGYTSVANIEFRAHRNMSQAAAYVSTDDLIAHKINVQVDLAKVSGVISRIY
ncbi:hypothetical protein BX666DRAFT_2025053 [Dichotomocladium elegans]|nr:hypothetical protein BX666DRAFT_2025053 [Dichotomocladium elegans]